MGTAKKNFKATKKYEKRHLKGVLESRKGIAKIKQRQQLKDKRKTKRLRDEESSTTSRPAAGDDAESSGPVRAKASSALSEMTVDDFFQTGGLDILDRETKSRKQPPPKKKPNQEETQQPDQREKQKKRPGDAALANARKRKRDAAPPGSTTRAFFSDEDDSPLGSARAAAATTDDDDDDDDDNDDRLFDDDRSADFESDDNGPESDLEMSHKVMQNLAQQDPEFYEFLKQNDPKALDFDENGDLAELDALTNADDGNDEDDDDDDDDDGPSPDQPIHKRKQTAAKPPDSRKKSKQGLREAQEVSSELVARWKESLTGSHSLKVARQVIVAFRCAVFAAEDSEDEQKRPPYKTADAQAYEDLVQLTLAEIPNVFQHHVPTKESASGKIYVPTEANKFKALSNLLKTFAASVLHLLGYMTDGKTIDLTLNSLVPVVPYLLTFRKLLKTLIRSLVAFWHQAASTEATRLTAFLVMRRLAVVGDRGVKEMLMKAMYQGIVQGSRATNSATISGINLMKNSAAELWLLDDSVAHDTCHKSLQQLAILLRTAIVHTKDKSYQTVYNWQYFHSLDFWSVVLSETCSTSRREQTARTSALEELLYPTIEIILGVIALVPSSVYFPLRFHLIRSLLRLSRSTGTYIPVAPQLLEVLHAPEMMRPPKRSTLPPLAFDTCYRAPHSYLHTRTYQNGVGDQLIELMAELLAIWSTNIGFPEMTIPIIIQLKRWLKASGKRNTGSRNQRFAAALALLVRKIRDTADAVVHRRHGVDFAPRDRAQVDAFSRAIRWESTPLGVYVLTQRAAAAQRSRDLEAARTDQDKPESGPEYGTVEEEEQDLDDAAGEGDEWEAQEDFSDEASEP